MIRGLLQTDERLLYVPETGFVPFAGVAGLVFKFTNKLY
jgi:hypothetical protein